MPSSAPRHKPMPQLARRHEVPGAADKYGQGRGGRPWRRKREQVMKRDGYLCQCEECKASGRLLIAHEVDHIDNKRGPDGRLNDSLTNLRAINRDCHRAKTAREASRGRMI